MKARLSSEEVFRKLLHLVALVLPAGVFYAPEFGVSRFSTCVVLLGLSLCSLSIELVRLKNSKSNDFFLLVFGSMMRKEERDRLTGATYVMLASFVCSLSSLLGDEYATASCFALSLFVLGDAAAALVGKSIGKTRIGRKTVEGFLGCFVLCLLLGYLLFPLLPGFLDSWGGPVTLFQACVLAAAVSFLELFPLRLGSFHLNDNLYVPLLVALIAMLVR